MNIKQESIRSNAAVKGYLAEEGITDLTTYVPETGFEGLTAGVKDAMMSVVSSACEKLKEAGANPDCPLTEGMADQLIAGLTRSVETYDAQAVSHYTGAAKASIIDHLTEHKAEVTDPWAHFVKSAKVATKPTGISFDL